MKLRNKKTGDICDFLGTYSATPYFGMAVDYHNGEPKSYEYNSLSELNAEWEDYIPKEPLIKDKKIRKAVRAWAEASNIDEAMFEYINDCGSVFSDGSMGIKICFYSDLHLVSRSDYTIAELCGEEE